MRGSARSTGFWRSLRLAALLVLLWAELGGCAQRGRIRVPPCPIPSPEVDAEAEGVARDYPETDSYLGRLERYCTAVEGE